MQGKEDDIMFRRIISLVASAGVLALAGAVLTSTPAHAALINNSCGPNYSWANTTGRVDVAGHYIPGTTTWYALRGGWDDNLRSVLSWASVTNAPAGTRVWMDWSDDGGANWHRCGNGSSGWVTVVSGNSSASTRAVNAVEGRLFRGCSNRPNSRNHCTGWH
jgi:hypothetical protein